MAETPEEIRNTLAHFTGTENYYKHLLGLKLTDGALYVAEACGAFWLMDIIASCKYVDAVAKEVFQVYKLTVNNGKGIVTVEDGNDNELYRQEIQTTDFPLDEITLWVSDNIILLPSEY